jgi:hypothetical protein
MKTEIDKNLTRVTQEPQKLAKLEQQLQKQKSIVQEAERQRLKALCAAHRDKGQPGRGQAEPQA